MMIQHALHQDEYLDVAKFYYKVWETPSIKEDTNSKGKAVCNPLSRPPLLAFPNLNQALEHIAYYIVLAPHTNEQSDMLHHLFTDPALTKLELQ
jgi:26S proteasome regulatory subunit N5